MNSGTTIGPPPARPAEPVWSVLPEVPAEILPPPTRIEAPMVADPRTERTLAEWLEKLKI